jgi:hypothetical protein
MAILCVGSYVYGVVDRSDVFEPSIVVIVAVVGLFNGWLLFSLVGQRRPDRGDDSDSGWGDPRRGR